jgi:hypothetical protein
MQFGVFSPIMRIHSSNETFTGREPWKFGAEYRAAIERFIRLRHQLLPYTYTMNARSHFDDEPIVEPMYYQYPEENAAYQVKNQYFFGSELMVCPITSKGDEELKLGKVKAFIPNGLWFDVFTGMSYTGGRTMDLFRPIDTIPVLAKAGAIIPMQHIDEISDDTSNPHHLELHVFVGDDNTFTMYEDDGETMAFEDGAFCKTTYNLNWKNSEFTIFPSVGDFSVIPESRDYSICFHGVKPNSVSGIAINGACQTFTSKFDKLTNTLTIELPNVLPTDTVVISISDATINANPIFEIAYENLNRAQIPFTFKENTYRLLKSNKSLQQKLSDIATMNMSENTQKMLNELLLANTAM